MTNPVHGIVQQAKQLDRGRLSRFGDSTQHDMPALSAAPCHTERHHALSDAVASPRPSNMRSIGERLDGARQGLAIDARLRVAELPGSPAENIPKIALCCGGQSNAPAVAMGHGPAAAFGDKSASALSERADRCSSDVAAESNVRNRPASMSAMPAFAASRIALRRAASSASRRSSRQQTARAHSVAGAIAGDPWPLSRITLRSAPATPPASGTKGPLGHRGRAPGSTSRLPPARRLRPAAAPIAPRLPVDGLTG